MMARLGLAFAAVFLCTLVLVPCEGRAQTEFPLDLDEDPTSPRIWIQNLDAIETMIERGQTDDRQMAEALKTVLQDIIDDAESNLSQERRRLGPLNAEMRTLGPGPEEGGAPESEELASIRTDLAGRISEVEGRIKATNLVIAKAENLLSRVSGTVRTEFVRLLDRSPSIFARETWQESGEGLATILSSIRDAPIAWWTGDSRRQRIVQILLLAIGMLVAFPCAFIVRRSLLRSRYRVLKTETEPTASSRILVACIKALRQLFIPLVAIGLVLGVIVAVLDVSQSFPHMLRALCFSAMIYIVIWGLTDSILSPDQPQWRLLKVTETGARILGRRLKIIGAYLALVTLIENISGYKGAPSEEYTAVAGFILNTIFAGLLLTLTPLRFWTVDEEGKIGIGFAIARLFVIFSLLSIPIIDVMGYSRLASLILAGVMLTVVLLALALLLRAGVLELLSQACNPSGRFYRGINDRFRLSEGTLGIIEIWLAVLAHIFIFGPVIYFLLISYGLQPEFLNLWLQRIVTGVRIGDFTISLLDIIVAIAIFVFAILVAGWFKRWLSEKLRVQTRMDSGARNSIVAGAGYVIIIIGGLIAVATLGLDFSKLAIVAGALSVGIGFGLRTVVENFVSGLLLLIERPIKVGDWIVAGGVEGTVKRISVRSTEIETFDRSSVIVPNSELISQPVKNWTHKNRTIRISVPVGVAYGSDTALVRDLLLKCAKSTPHVLGYPEPYVVFMSFGESSLDFQIRVYVQDTDYYITVLSGLHFAIDAAFREHNISIPFPQRDIHIIEPDDGKSAPIPDPVIDNSAIKAETQD